MHIYAASPSIHRFVFSKPLDYSLDFKLPSDLPFHGCIFVAMHMKMFTSAINPLSGGI